MLNNKDTDWRLRPEHSLLLLVDVQEKLQPLIHEREKIEKNCVILLRAAAEFKLPVLLTEQYPKGLGPTVHEVKEAAEAAGASFYAKTRFSVLTDDIRPALEASGRRQIILCGVETHIASPRLPWICSRKVMTSASLPMPQAPAKPSTGSPPSPSCAMPEPKSSR